MKRRLILTGQLLGSGLFLLVLLSLLAGRSWASGQNNLAPSDQSIIILDGVRDGDYVLVAADPPGDLASPGPADWSGTQWTELTNLYVAADAATLYVYADLPGYFFDGSGNDSTGRIGLALDVDGEAGSGGSSDPWGNAITFDYDNIDGFAGTGPFLPDYLIRGNVSNDGGWTELREWNGNWNTGSGVNWGGINGGTVGSHIAYSYTHGVEFAIPLADIGSPHPSHVHLQFFATQEGGSKGAYDTVPSDDQSSGWDDPTTQKNLVSVPLAIDPLGDLASPGPADWNGVHWTDMSRLHIWADSQKLNVFIPSEAYSTTLSQGQIVMALDTKSGGGSGDPWGNAITFAYTATHQNLGTTPVLTTTTLLPDYLIRGNIFGPADNGWTELRTWNGFDWNTGSGVDWGGIGNSGQPSLPGSNIAWSNGEGLRLTIPLTDINASPGSHLNLEFIATQSGGGKGAYDTVPSDDQSTGWDDPTTQKFLASFTIPGETEPPPPTGCNSGAAQDNNIFWGDLGHNSRDGLYRSPGGPVTTDTTVTLRLRSACDDLTGASVRLYNDRTNIQMMLPLTKVSSGTAYDWWEAQLPVGSDPTIYWYRFVAVDGSSTAYYEDDSGRTGGWGQPYGESQDISWQLTVFDPNFQTPDWVKDAVIYQIFPDRFRDGNGANNTPAGTFFYNEAGGTIYRSNQSTWNQYVCDPRDQNDCPGTYSKNFYGGDLQGILDKLDYLQSIGVTTLYFNPIFESPSNHKYDTTDFSVIDDNFGSLALFQLLAAEADNRDMNIILDGVFNHTSSDSIYFDRYHRYPAPHGACETQNSPFRLWYYFQDVTAGSGPCVGSTGTPNGANYESWFGFDSLPKLNSSNQDVRDLIWDDGVNSIGRYWMQWADGWRLDVGGDVDPGLTNDPNNDYWEGFRNAVHQTNPDAYIVLEEWGNASPWLLGAEMDATMNYQYSSAMLSFWRDEPFVDNDHNSGSSAGPLNPITPSQLDERLHNWIERYPPEALYAMMNLLGSHDTNRPLFMLDHNTDLNDPAIYENPAYDWSDAINRLKGVTILQMTLPGAPTIYYGDEVGLVGPVAHDGSTWQDDPYNRQPFPWLDETGTPFYSHLQTQGGQDNLKDHYTLVTGIRNSHPALRTGSFDTLLVDDGAMVYAYGRLLADYSDAAVVILNRSNSFQQTVTLDVSGYLPIGGQFEDALNGDTPYTVNANGELVVNVPAMSGAILVSTGALTPPPAAVTDLAVTAERSEELDLGWSAAAGADSYDIYRSPISGGGYQLITNTTNTAYTDSGLQNAVQYYYVVVSRDDTSGLLSGNSNEAGGTPHHDLTGAWYNLQWPPEIFHTISTITPTENIYGQLWIGGETGPDGPATGILAQVGYGISGTLPTDPAWLWLDMAYNAPAGNNDEYFGNLLPDMLGDYHYATRYSSDGGQSWYYADLNGPGLNGNPGLLHVLPGSDTTAPAAPTNLTLEGTTGGSVSMSWDANGEGDLAGYEIYRQTVSTTHLLFNRIATVGPAETGYTDESVITGQTYDYYILAFDTSFNRSALSNIIQATAEPRFVEVTFNVTVPAETPGTVYIVGSVPEIGNWNPGAVPMAEVTTGTWTITRTILDGTPIAYKFTRGNWETVEKEADGNTEIPDRQLTINYGLNGTQTVNLTVANWRDPIVVAHSPAVDATDVPTDTVISTTWNQAMNANATFLVEGPSGPVSGTFGYDAGSFTLHFTATGGLEPNTTYTVTAAGVVDSAGDVQQVPVLWSFHTFGRIVTVNFHTLVPAFTEGTVYLYGAGPELGDWDPAAGIPMKQIVPTNSIPSGFQVWTLYLEFTENTPLAFKFSRGSAETVETLANGNSTSPDRTATVIFQPVGPMVIEETVANWLDPLVTAHSPEDGATDVPLDSAIIVTWSQAMNPATDFTVLGPGGPLAGTFSYDAGSFTVTFTPGSGLEPLTTYTVTVSEEVDAGGDVQQVPLSWTFQTADATVVSYIIYAPYVSKAPVSQAAPAVSENWLVNLASDKIAPSVLKFGRDGGGMVEMTANGNTQREAIGRQTAGSLAVFGGQAGQSNQWLWRAWPWLMLVVGVGALMGYLMLAERRKEFILHK